MNRISDVQMYIECAKLFNKVGDLDTLTTNIDKDIDDNITRLVQLAFHNLSSEMKDLIRVSFNAELCELLDL